MKGPTGAPDRVLHVGSRAPHLFNGPSRGGAPQPGIQSGSGMVIVFWSYATKPAFW